MTGLDTTFLVQVEVQEADAHGAALDVLRREVAGRRREAALAPQVLSVDFAQAIRDGGGPQEWLWKGDSPRDEFPGSGAAPAVVPWTSGSSMGFSGTSGARVARIPFRPTSKRKF